MKFNPPDPARITKGLELAAVAPDYIAARDAQAVAERTATAGTSELARLEREVLDLPAAIRVGARPAGRLREAMAQRDELALRLADLRRVAAEAARRVETERTNARRRVEDAVAARAATMQEMANELGPVLAKLRACDKALGDVRVRNLKALGVSSTDLGGLHGLGLGAVDWAASPVTERKIGRARVYSRSSALRPGPEAGRPGRHGGDVARASGSGGGGWFSRARSSWLRRRAR